jgi:hypothetical protein
MSKLTARRGRAILASLIAAFAMLVVAVPSGSAAPATAEISVAFSSDFLSASISSSKGVSHYDVVLCDGSAWRHEMSGDDRDVTVGPFDAEIVSVAVKSATTKTTFYSGFTGECKKKTDDDKK